MACVPWAPLAIQLEKNWKIVEKKEEGETFTYKKEVGRSIEKILTRESVESHIPLFYVLIPS